MGRVATDTGVGLDAGVRRDDGLRARARSKWVPACAGMTVGELNGRPTRLVRAGPSAAAFLLVFRQVRAELTERAIGQLLVLFREILAFPLGQRFAFEVKSEVLDFGLAGAADALGGGVVPTVVVERVGYRRRTEQRS